MNSALDGIGMTSQRTRVRMIQRLREQGIGDERVLAAMAAVPRHIFVEPALAHRAYEDTALPLGFAQTISQPYVVARMTELLAAGRELGKTLEIGSGCGYQAAVLAMLTRDVYTIERIAPLVERARANLKQLKLFNVRVRHGDGNLGLPRSAPFDTIILAASAAKVPATLLGQLAAGGRMMLPLGTSQQILLLLERKTDGAVVETRFDAVRFVPLLAGTQ